MTTEATFIHNRFRVSHYQRHNVFCSANCIAQYKAVNYEVRDVSCAYIPLFLGRMETLTAVGYLAAQIGPKYPCRPR